MNIFYLWLLPDSPTFDLFERKISDLSRIYNLPTFLPHITLLSISSSPRDIENKVRNLALSRVSAQTVAAATSTDFFQSIFLPVLPRQQLSDIHKQLAQSFGQQPKTNYNPHISLLYGEHSHGRRMDILRSMSQLNQQFTCSRIALVAGGERVEQWHILTIFQLIGGDEQ